MLSIGRKLSLLRHAYWMQQGKLLAHHTSTLAGVACVPSSLSSLCFFKQRQGPFLLLVANMRTALKFARYISPNLRQYLQQGWPDKTTLIFSARQGLDPRLYRQGTLAIRVDSDLSSCFLAKKLGGYFVSSSLNRRGRKTQEPTSRQAWRWQRFDMRSATHVSHPLGDQASTLLRIKHSSVQRLR